MVMGINNDGLQQRLQNNINKVNNKLTSNLNKLATGRRINKASDGPAALVLGTRLESDASTLRKSLENIQSSVSMVKVAGGSLGHISKMLSRASELALQSSNTSLKDSSRSVLNSEFNSIKNEINRIAQVTEFNGQKLIDGGLAPNSSNQVNIQVGIPGNAGDQISLNVIQGSSTTDLGLENTDISTQANASNALAAIDNAMNLVTANQAGVGAFVGRLSQASSHLGISIENLTSAASSVMDLDYASETSSFSQNQILQNASLMATAQANVNQVGQLLNLKI